MKLHVLSDIHLEQSFGRPHAVPPDIDFDVLVVAGDLSPEPEQSVAWLLKNAQGRPVVFVPGNHDFWCRVFSIFGAHGELPEFEKRLQELRDRCRDTDIHFLHQDTAIIDGVRFVGCPLWTDLGSHFRGNYYFRRKRNQPDPNLLIGAFGMNDCYAVGATRWYADPANIDWIRSLARELTDDTMTYSDTLRVEEFIRKGILHPLITWRWHQEQRAWLEATIKQRFPEEGEEAPPWKKTVVVTHHPPSWTALVTSGTRKKELTQNPYLWGSARLPRDPEGVARLSAYGSGGMPDGTADLWIHGHLHASVRYIENNIPCFCNPYGYDGDASGFEPRLILDLEVLRPEHALAPTVVAVADRIVEIHAELRSLLDALFHEDAVIRRTIQARFDALANEGANRLRTLRQEIETAPGISYAMCEQLTRTFPQVWHRQWSWDSARDIAGRKINRTKAIRDFVALVAVTPSHLRSIVK